MPGTLHVVATPIGNLEDVSPRALRTLRDAAWIACEDTRRTAKLLARHGIETRMLSCHRFNEGARLQRVLGILRQGEDVALVSDGGTPAISDPGALLVEAAVAEGIPVVPVPGPSAPVTLLSVSGIDASRFVFDGFLPARSGERRGRLRELRDEPRPVVLFEAPHRLRQALRDMAEILGGRGLVLGRELTKSHETVLRGTAAEVENALPEGEIKGEIAIVLAPMDPSAGGSRSEETATRVVEAWDRALVASSGDARDALRTAAKELGMKRAALHRLLAELGRLDRPRR